MLLELEALTVNRGARRVLDAVSLAVGPGEVVGLIGPNGAGKTTLMRAALGLLPHGGQSSLAALPPRGRARAAAWMPQAREIAWPVTVETLVALGRGPHVRPRQPLGAHDRAAVDRALARLDLDAFRHRIALELSAGEQARVLLARALAQETPLLLADEPTAGLDPAHGIATMEVFRGLAAAGRSVLLSLHDFGLAARHCTRLLLLQQGRLVADGRPLEVLRPDAVAAVFGVRLYSAETSEGPVVQPLELAQP
jgi:iron complex transport system ATP-binding protein